MLKLLRDLLKCKTLLGSLTRPEASRSRRKRIEPQSKHRFFGSYSMTDISLFCHIYMLWTYNFFRKDFSFLSSFSVNSVLGLIRFPPSEYMLDVEIKFSIVLYV